VGDIAGCVEDEDLESAARTLQRVGVVGHERDAEITVLAAQVTFTPRARRD